MSDDRPSPNLRDILEQNYRWIFVGGKGGVGKTTTTCCIGIQLAKVKSRVLIVSTDPAHNLSDAFDQQFTSEPTRVKGTENLYCLEIDPKAENSSVSEKFSKLGMDEKMAGDITGAMPGIDEAMGFLTVLRLVKSLDFPTVLFDTAPTGHTLRLLHFPELIEGTLGKMLGGGLSGLFSQVSQMLGVSVDSDNFAGMKDVITEVVSQFRNPDVTTFVCVCIPEFLSLYETERLLQELVNVGIDSNSIVVNQVIFPQKNSCSFCLARRTMQQKYIDQIETLYADDFHVVLVPLQEDEVRGLESLKAFSELYVNPVASQ